MKRLILIFSIVALASCVHAPSNLNPQATAAWYGTRVIKALDVVRDTAIEANNTVPPMLSTNSTRRVVEWHQAAIKTVHEAPNGWKSLVESGAKNTLSTIEPHERNIIQPYVTLLLTLLKEL